MAGRNANGEGSIYKRKDGRYEGSLYLTTVSGRSKRLRVYGRTRNAVHKKLTEAKAQMLQGTPTPDRAWRLSEYLDHWLEDIVKVNRRPATYAQCEMVTRLYLKPTLGKFELKQLSVPAVQGVINESLGEGKSIPKVQVIRKVLSSALTSAQREELVNRNVARLAVLPTYEREEVTPWTVEEARTFLGVSQSNILYPAFVLLLLYGLRRGEVLGLRWCDIDFEQDTIHVRHQLQRVGRSLELGPVKTKAGRRPLPLLGFVRTVLLNHRGAQGSIQPDSLVFTASDGGPLEASVLVRAFQRLCQKHGIRPVRIHDLRHGFATLLKDLGAPVRDAQLLLGHARVTTTQEIYQHDNMDRRRSSLELVASALAHSQPKNDTLRYRLAGTRSRQFSRQARDFVAFVTSSISGAGEETLTLGLILGKSPNGTLSDRLTSVKAVSKRRTRAWLLGCVAVKIAVNHTPPVHSSWQTVCLRDRPKAWTP